MAVASHHANWHQNAHVCQESVRMVPHVGYFNTQGLHLSGLSAMSNAPHVAMLRDRIQQHGNTVYRKRYNYHPGSGIFILGASI